MDPAVQLVFPWRPIQCSISSVLESNVRSVCEHLFVSESALQWEDLAFFSGFVAGDGCFMIRSNNAGTSWCCTLDVKLRSDDTPLLRSFQEWTGVGQLFRSPARGRSSPQTNWRVGRRLDCLKVVELLVKCPPLGKAARQFDVWQRAVRAWIDDGGAASSLPGLAAGLAALHHTTTQAPCRVDITEADLAAFLAGFASAEAHFGATTEGSPTFGINLRADDAPLLRLFHETFGIGGSRTSSRTDHRERPRHGTWAAARS
jgi:hypothetical protein